MSDPTSAMRILEPFPGIFAYYDGRVLGRRLHSAEPNWLDDGAYSLGTASYAIADGGEALVYDTHMSLAHARVVRAHLAGLGIARPRVVLSHWHADHIAGNEVFADCEIVALALTAEIMARHRADIESRDPPIVPVVMPNRTFETQLGLNVGARRVDVHHFDIHSSDGAVLWLPDERILFAGDTLEDTVTYIMEPEHVATHIRNLARLRTWPIHRILPNHGDPERIAAGGYEASLIDANRAYLERLSDPDALACAEEGTLRDFIAEDMASGAVIYFEPYEAVHRKNIADMVRVGQTT